MGMDVYGRSGNYFRANVWSWHPLAAFCQYVGSFLSESCNWHTNDGEGLGADESSLLGRKILQDIENGNAQKYVDRYNKTQVELVCEFCDGKKYVENIHGSQKCGFCQGEGNRAHYNRLSIEGIKEFAEFMIESEGFYIC